MNQLPIQNKNKIIKKLVLYLMNDNYSSIFNLET